MATINLSQQELADYYKQSKYFVTTSNKTYEIHYSGAQDSYFMTCIFGQGFGGYGRLVLTAHELNELAGKEIVWE